MFVTKEELSAEIFGEALEKMIEKRSVFVGNMKTAVEIAVNDPGAGTEVLRFYTDLLIKNKNAEFLINRIIEKQWTHEILNLDFLILALFALVGTVILIGIFIYKSVRYCCRFRKSKTKSE